MRDRVAVFTVFALNGLAVGSWATRTPALTAQVHASPGVFGLALFGASVGMLLTASVSGRVVERAGARAAVAGSTLVAAAALVLIGFAPGVAVLAAALFVIGGSIGILDVAMNVAAVAVERRSRRPVLPVFHAGFSFGALAGSLAAGLAAGHGWSPARHLAVAAVVAVVVLLSVIRAVPGSRPEPTAEPVVTPWRAAPVRRPVLWLLAAVALCSAIAEGAAGDWSALLMTAERGVGPGAAALAFAGFQLAMTLTR
ncbi:MFS transporter, partial [Amycolatopsis mediterranei]